MFDCPEQTQTSPTSRFFSVTVRLPHLTVMVTGPFSDAFIAGRLADQSPAVSEVALDVSPVLIFTSTSELAGACPQIFNG